MADIYRTRRIVSVIIALATLLVAIFINQPIFEPAEKTVVVESESSVVTASPAIEALQTLEVKGRAQKTDYSREQFGAGWSIINGCDMRNIILNRDLIDAQIDNECNMTSGTLNDPYTGKVILFQRGTSTSADVQIDHVVALSDAWQKGAQLLERDKRIELANDPLELLAVDGSANQQKSDGDAATWLPSNKPFRCQYVARQIAVKQKYSLWVTIAEKQAMETVLNDCPGQTLPKAD